MHEIVQTSVMITVFVMLMMLVIEYINVQTRGRWSEPLKQKKGLQIFISAFLGVVPGCLGVYTVVSLFTHKIVSFGALVTAMIATSGDEAFVMFAMMPKEALWLNLAIFVVAIVAGFVTDIFYKNVSFSKSKDHSFHVHQEEQKCDCFSWSGILNNFKSFHLTRILILVVLIVFGVNLILGSGGHGNHSADINKEVFTQPVYEAGDNTNIQEETRAVEQSVSHDKVSEKKKEHLNFPKIIFIILTLVALFIILTVPNHFVEEHIWSHVIKRHFLRIFLWTFGTLLVIFLAKDYMSVDIQQLAQDNLWLILILAVLIGIIPESGPHMIFISLFVSGIIPISILFASSIVQDGHGSLPLFAENKKAFLHMKLINMLVGGLFGIAGLVLGF